MGGDFLLQVLLEVMFQEIMGGSQGSVLFCVLFGRHYYFKKQSEVSGI